MTHSNAELKLLPETIEVPVTGSVMDTSDALITDDADRLHWIEIGGKYKFALRELSGGEYSGLSGISIEVDTAQVLQIRNNPDLTDEERLEAIKAKGLRTNMNMQQAQIAKMALMIKQWNLTCKVVKDGKQVTEPLPITQENIKNLRRSIFDKLGVEINRFEKSIIGNEQIKN